MRETYLSSLGMAYLVLCDLGVSAEQAYENIETFRDYDEKLLARQQSIYTDEQKIVETHRNMLAELEHLFESDERNQPVSSGVNLQRGLENDTQKHRINVTRDDHD